MNRVLIVFLLPFALLPAAAQTGLLRGTVTDESGAVIPGAVVTLAGPRAATTTAIHDGTYSFPGLPPGSYTVQASAPQLAMRRPMTVAIDSGTKVADLVLTVSIPRQQVTVDETAAPAVSTDPSGNASAVVLRGADLDALSDNQSDLAADLRALAGPGAGPRGGAIFIDGFSGGELPAKNTIREIRINQSPFSPEYDRIGVGRIEIFTKPGADKFHADLGYNFATDKWNSRNPYAQQKAPFHLHEFREGLSGPIGRRASFNLAFVREWVDNGSVVNGVILDPRSQTPVAFTDVPLATLRRTALTPRVDYQLAPRHTLTLRYSYSRDDVRNAGVGGFNLVSRGFRQDVRTQTVQIGETATLGKTAVNETRFQFLRPDIATAANTPGAAIDVLSAFSAGGAPMGHATDRQKLYEFQNNTSIARARHTWRFGVRLRAVTQTNESPQNFGGTFTFGGGLGFDSIERYRRTLIGAPGGGATQFTINAGDPLTSVRQLDLGAFAGDDWKLRSNLTVSLGLRYEIQTNLRDRRDIAPRVAVAWAPGARSAAAKPRSVIRAGFGMFYERFGLDNTLAARRYDGVVQRQYVVADPDFFPNVPTLSLLSGAPSAVRRIDPATRAPYLAQATLAFERELPRSTTLAVTYAHTTGRRMLRSRALSAAAGPVFTMESTGRYRQNQWTVNVNSKLNRDVSLTGSYEYNRARSDTDGPGTFPANPRTLDGEYGPAATDIRHRVSLLGTITSLWGIRWNPLLTANSGPPFDITVGHDLYGTTLFNGRPGIAADRNQPGVVATPYGLLDPNPASGQRLLSRNSGRGPGQVMLNMRVGRTFRFGAVREGAAAANTGGGVGAGGAAVTARRFSLTVSLQVRNVTNHTNPGPIIGNIASPLFGRANQPAGSGGGVFSESANNRRLEPQIRLTF